MVTVGVFAQGVGESEGSTSGVRLLVSGVKANVNAESVVVFSPQRNLLFFKLCLQEFLVWTKMEGRSLRFL